MPLRPAYRASDAVSWVCCYVGTAALIATCSGPINTSVHAVHAVPKPLWRLHETHDKGRLQGIGARDRNRCRREIVMCMAESSPGCHGGSTLHGSALLPVGGIGWGAA